MCRGIPLKGQLCIRTEFGKQGKRKREEGNREERERERGRRRDADGDRKQEEFTQGTEENSKHSLALRDITPAHRSVSTFPLFPSWHSCPSQEHRCVQSVNFMFHLASQGHCPRLQSNHVKLPLSRSWFRLRRGAKTNDCVSAAGTLELNQTAHDTEIIRFDVICSLCGIVSWMYLKARRMDKSSSKSWGIAQH